MEWMQLPLGQIQANTYIVYHKGECLIVDPGGEEKKIRQFIQKKGLEPKAILLTHAHFDHIGAVEPIRKAYSIPVYLHVAEKKWLSNPSLNGSAAFEGVQPVIVNPAEYTFEKSEKLSIGRFLVEVIETPGHSPGSVSFYFEEEGFVIVGDTLFEGGMGRTDLKGGEEKQLFRSIKEKLLTLPEETYVLPGHDGVTTIGRERNTNPFLNKKRSR